MTSEANPYASPEAPRSSPDDGRISSASAIAFRSNRPRAVFAIATLSVNAIVDLSLALVTWWEIDLLGRSLQQELSEDAFESTDFLLSIVGTTEWVVSCVAGVAFLMWFYRAHANLRPLGVPDLQYSPGWAVGWFFVPLLNVVKPYHVAKEIYSALDSHGNPRGLKARKANRGIWRLRVWWITWITANVLSFLAYRAWQKAQGTMELLGADWLALIAILLMALAAILAIAVIRAIERQQDSRASALGLGNNSSTLAIHRVHAG